ncbi:MAG: hypothetical protein K2X77_24195 [Candidatus Obscuribacterales bacterium]|jgi:hypothetical protein|nr:hypothetical protein [Candidatus Obscuribacterales bacterium]
MKPKLSQVLQIIAILGVLALLSIKLFSSTESPATKSVFEGRDSEQIARCIKKTDPTPFVRVTPSTEELIPLMPYLGR